MAHLQEILDLRKKGLNRTDTDAQIVSAVVEAQMAVKEAEAAANALDPAGTGNFDEADALDEVPW